MKLSALPVIALVALPLAGCGGDVERTFGLTRDAPDEFTVTTRAPLSIPPDYTLRPPAPGAGRPQELSAQQAAEAALAPEAVLQHPTAEDSPGQQALLAASGPAAPADIRDKINAEQGLDAPHRGLTERLMFWKDAPAPGTPLDAVGESKRLREDSALGQPPTLGETPVIQDKKPDQGWFHVF